MHALVINLKSKQDRRSYMVNQLNKLEIDYTIMDAVDVNAISDSYYITLRDTWERRLRKSEVCCFLSHKRAWELVLKENKPYIIFEDDIVFSEKAQIVLNSLYENSDFNFINIETTPRRKLIDKKSYDIIENFKLTKLLHNKTGSGAYIIWPKYAKKLLKKYNERNAATADAALYTNFFNICQFQLNPAIAVQIQYCDEFGLEKPLFDVSSISNENKKKVFNVRNKIKRLFTQYLILTTYIFNFPTSMLERIKFCK